MSDAEVSRRVQGTLNEYLSLQNVPEAKACFNEIPANKRAQAVDAMLWKSLEAKPKHRVLLATLLVESTRPPMQTYTAEDVTAACSEQVEMLMDNRIDIPMVQEYLGYMLGVAMSHECLSLPSLLRSIQRTAADPDAGTGLAGLVSSGVCLKLLAAAFKACDDEAKAQAQTMADDAGGAGGARSIDALVSAAGGCVSGLRASDLLPDGEEAGRGAAEVFQAHGLEALLRILD